MFRRNLIIGVAVFGLLFSTSARAATSTSPADEYLEAKNSISQQINCSQLTQEQLEKIGDYYMEQMMPGQAHTNMEQILGGEGSDSLREAHIFMARRWYCGDAAGYGMMGMMGGNSVVPVARGGMMGGWANPSWNSGYGMMGFGPGYYGGYGWFGALMMVGFGVLIIFGILAALKYLRNK